MKPFLIAGLIILLFSHLALSTSLINVPLDHWSYDFIARMQARGILGKYLSNTKPYSRGEMSEMIKEIVILYESGKIELTPVDLELLEEMKKEFAGELPELGMQDGQKYKYLVAWEDGERKFIAEAELDQESTFITDAHDVNHTDVKAYFRGDILKNLSFYNYSRISRTDEKAPLSKINKDPRYLPYRCTEFGCADAESDAYLAYGSPKISIQAGKDDILWGAGYQGVIGLSAVNHSFDAIKIHTKIWMLNFSSLLGFLRDNLTKKYLSDVPKKHLLANRLELTPFSGLCIGLQEAYIYADKLSIGNNAVEWDAELTLIPHTKLYGAVFLDDFYTDKNPFKYPGFPWAASGGAMIVDPFGLDNTHILAEYTRVEPWTYTHEATMQSPPVPISYKHFEEPLGHWIGPNADNLFVQMGWRIIKNVQGNISYNRIRHGEIGGNIYDVPDLTKEKEFLGGIVETMQGIGAELGYTTFHRFDIRFGYKYIRMNNRQKDEAKLPETDMGKQDWKPGWNTSWNEFSILVQFRY